jgi:hypothetical protein
MRDDAGQDNITDWAISEAIHPSVFGFLRCNESLGATIYTDRKGWAAVSGILAHGTAEDHRTALTVILGDVGIEHFCDFLTLVETLPLPPDILAGTAPDLPDHLAARMASFAYGFSAALAGVMGQRLHHLKTAWGSAWRASDALGVWKSEADTALAYMLRNLSIEFGVVFMQHVFQQREAFDLLIVRKAWQRAAVNMKEIVV